MLRVESRLESERFFIAVLGWLSCIINGDNCYLRLRCEILPFQLFESGPFDLYDGAVACFQFVDETGGDLGDPVCLTLQSIVRTVHVIHAQPAGKQKGFFLQRS